MRTDQTTIKAFYGQNKCGEAATIEGKKKSKKKSKKNQKKIKKNRDAARDYRPCAAHDLAPVLEKMFGVKHKDLAQDKDCVSLVEGHGIKLGDRSYGGSPKVEKASNLVAPKKSDKKKPRI